MLMAGLCGRREAKSSMIAAPLSFAAPPAIAPRVSTPRRVSLQPHARPSAVQPDRDRPTKLGCRSRSTGTASPTWSRSGCSCWLAVAARQAAAVRRARLDAARRRGPAVLRRARRRARRPAGLRAVLQAGLLRSRIRSRSSRSGRAACRSTAACSACSARWRCSRVARKRRSCEVTDLIAPCVPLGLASGRIGNFINGELWGRAGRPDAAVGDGVPADRASTMPRHPSQLYQFALEGLLLFVLLWLYARQARASSARSRPPS